MNLNYETVCKLMGHLYIEGQSKQASLEEQLQRLLIANKELEAKLREKENANGLSTERTDS